MKRPLVICLFLAVLMVVVPVVQAQTPEQIKTAINAAYAKYKDLQEGKNADYIPALAKVDPKLFGIALVTADGKDLYRRRHHDGSLDPVDIESVHDGPGDPGAGARYHCEHHRCGCHGDAVQFHREH